MPYKKTHLLILSFLFTPLLAFASAAGVPQGNTTNFALYERGIPKSEALPTGTNITRTVDPSGAVASVGVTDPVTHRTLTTRYEHTPIGLLCGGFYYGKRINLVTFGLCHDFFNEVVCFFLDTFAQFKTNIINNFDRSINIGDGLLNGFFVIHHKGL